MAIGGIELPEPHFFVLEPEDAVLDKKRLWQVSCGCFDVFNNQGAFIIQFVVLALNRVTLAAVQSNVGFDQPGYVKSLLCENLVDPAHIQYAFGADMILHVAEILQVGSDEDRVALKVKLERGEFDAQALKCPVGIGNSSRQVDMPDRVRVTRRFQPAILQVQIAICFWEKLLIKAKNAVGS